MVIDPQLSKQWDATKTKRYRQESLMNSPYSPINEMTLFVKIFG